MTPRTWLDSFRSISLPALLLLALLVPWSVGCSSDAAGDGTAEASESDETKPDDDAEDPDAEANKDGEEGEGKDDGEDEKEKETPVPVEVVALARGSIQSAIRATANLEAENEVMVFSQAARLIRELWVEEGDRVEKNEILIRLQDDEQRSALAKVESQYAKAARDYERMERLHKKDLIADEVFNNATYDVEQLKLGLEDAKRNLTYTEVRAPISGTITARQVQVGDQITIGQHLFDLVDFDSIVARIYIPEKELPRLAVDQTARVTTQGAGRRSHRGHVVRISPVVDPQTGTVKVTVGFDRTEGIRPGMYVDVNLITEIHRNTLLVPKRALVYDQDQVFVYRLGEERRVERLLLEPALEDSEYVMPAGGFEAGDEIVVAGQAGLKNQSLVRLPGDPDAEEEESGEGESDDEKAQVASKEGE